VASFAAAAIFVAAPIFSQYHPDDLRMPLIEVVLDRVVAIHGSAGMLAVAGYLGG
jgi:hypothetical protein